MSKNTYKFECLGCHEVDTITEVELLPRFTYGLIPDPNNVFGYEYPDLPDSYLDVEDTQIIGVACQTVDCKYSWVNVGTAAKRTKKGAFRYQPAFRLLDIARIRLWWGDE